jgi:hypothetical protein
MPEHYDSKLDTNKHRFFVRMLMYEIAKDIMERADHHDDSKLLPPEKELFDEYTPKLKGCTYGSPEYNEFLKGLKQALDHHYAENRHHPEHFPEGMNGMNLVDMVELICDWFAATMRHDDGDINKSLQINKKRFNMDEQTVTLLKNTVDTYFSSFSHEDY